jgi:acyl-CoA reductase-like NAD-dependent aldehyde dehydrogenase
MAKLVTTNIGKPITQSKYEIDQSIEKAENYIKLSNNVLKDDILLSNERITKKIVMEPVGIVIALLPWEFPIFDIVNCLVPAILSGNAILLKDNPDTPVLSEHFERALSDSAPGVAQKFFINPMDVQNLYKKKQVDSVVFSGTYNSALDIYLELAQNDFIENNMDIGGMNYAYIGEDCDLEKAVEKVMWGVFYNSG